MLDKYESQFMLSRTIKLMASERTTLNQAAADAVQTQKSGSPIGIGEVIEIQISTDAAIHRHLSRQAQEELQAKLSELSVVVLKEAQSLESGDRAPGADPDISRSYIQEAWFNARRKMRKDRVGPWGVLLRSFYSVCMFLVGFGVSHLSTWWGALMAVGGGLLGGACIAALVALKSDS